MGPVLAAALMLALAACADRTPREWVAIEPSYAFTLGAHQADVMSALGWPAQGPRFDTVSGTVELVYSYPFRAIQAETEFPTGVTRSEMVDTIHLFFDADGVLVKMGSWVDRWYPSVVQMPVQRVTVLPRLLHHPSGVVTAPRAPPDAGDDIRR